MREEIWKKLFESSGPLPNAPLKKGVFPADIKKIISKELKNRGFIKVKTKFFFRENETFYECFQIQKLTSRDYYYLHFGVVIKSLDHLYSEMGETYSWHVHGNLSVARRRPPLKDPYEVENSLTPEERHKLISGDIDYVIVKRFQKWRDPRKFYSDMKKPAFFSELTVKKAAEDHIRSICEGKS